MLDANRVTRRASFLHMLDANRVIPELALPGRVVNTSWGRFGGGTMILPARFPDLGENHGQKRLSKGTTCDPYSRGTEKQKLRMIGNSL